MEKKVLFIIAMMCVVLGADAKRISENEAYNRAVDFSIDNGYAMSRGDDVAKLVSKTDNYYVYNYNAGGFVILSGSDLTADVLGYSDSGSFNVDDIPAQLEGLLSQYNDEIDHVENSDIAIKKSRSEEVIYDPIAPMVKTKYGQRYPYNVFCPIKKGRRTLTGCVATATVTILTYYQNEYNLTGVYTDIFLVDGEEVSVKADTCYADYSKILSIDSNDLEVYDIHFDIARLTKLCGVMLNMNYGLSGSSSKVEKIPGVLKLFDYDENVTCISRYKYKSQGMWEEIIYNNLKTGPIIYRVCDSKYMGHALVIDGYENGYFHLDWGWYNRYNGFYKLTALPFDFSPEGFDTNINLTHRAVINIKPNHPIKQSGISDIKYDNNDIINVYDIYGNIVYTGINKKLDFLDNGIYIKKNGLETKKIIIH